MKIRQAKQEDAEAILSVYAPYVEETIITFETQVPSLEDFQVRMATIMEKFPYLVAEVDGQILGYTYAHTYYARDAYDWTLELSIYVDRNRRQAGIGQALYDVLEEKLSKQNVVNLLACISLPNEPSIRFHQKRGFEQIGHFKKVGFKFGQWCDTVWMQKRLRDAAVPEPILYKNEEDVL
ncbi:N-acetyltransferase family protein [Streptococcus sp.]|uniref:GNAT family N-acetyltransferase n=1 Tax=Streptococcus sp. TaxID=1306 RepID=UPI0035A1D0E8